MSINDDGSGKRQEKQFSAATQQTELGSAQAQDPSVSGQFVLQDYYKLVEDFVSNASTTRLLTTGGIAIPLMAYLFGVPIFFLLVGIAVGIYIAFAAISPWKNQDLEPLPWKKGGTSKAEVFEEEWRPLIQSSYSPSKPIEEVISRASDIIIEKYVKVWYTDLSPNDTTFLRQTLLDTAFAFSGQQALKRPADIFLVLLFSLCNTFVVFLRELRSVSADYSTKIGGVYEYIAANPESALAQMLDPAVQRAKFRNAADNMVQTFLPVLDMKRSPVAILAREIISTQVLEAIVETFSNPDEVNRWIIYFLQREENIQALAQSEMTLREEGLQPQDPIIAGTVNKDLPVPNRDIDRVLAPITQPLQPKLASPQRLPTTSDDDDEADIASYAALSSIEESEYDSPIKSGPDYDSQDDELKTPTLASTETMSRRVHRKPVGSVAVSSATASDEEGYQQQPATTFDELLRGQDFSRNSSLPQSAGGTPSNAFSHKQTELAATSLYQANIMVIDSSADGNQTGKVLMSKPLGFYTLVIEPAGTAPGWMAMRNISDFERLHIVLQKLATLAGLTTFPDIFPSWHGVTRSDYCQTLQLYLQLVVSTRELADCEAMKKFVDKKETASVTEKRWQKPPIFKHAGEGMKEALSRATMATSSAGESRRAILNVLSAAKRQSVDTLNRTKDTVTMRQKQSFLNGPDFSGLAASVRNLTNGGGPSIHSGLITNDSSHSLPGYSSEVNYSSDSISTTSTAPGDGYTLPPPPSEIDSYDTAPRRSLNLTTRSTPAIARSSSLRNGSSAGNRVDTGTSDIELDPRLIRSSLAPDRASATGLGIEEHQPRIAVDQENRRSAIIASHQPLSHGETNSLIDSLFLAISELYLLSNAWNVRRSLLTVLRGLLLRNGSSSVEGVRAAIQKDIIDKYASEDELARKLNDLVNAVWPDQPAAPQPSPSENSESLKNEARKMFISRAIPDGIKSVMGAGASSQALEYVFDVLQDRNIARETMLRSGDEIDSIND